MNVRLESKTATYSATALALVVIAAQVGCLGEPTYAPRDARVQASGDGGRDLANVVLISIDTTRADHLSSYGFAKPTTPNIDAVAADGLLFLRAQSTNSVTLPAHSSMLTGMRPPTHGVRDNYDYRLADEHTTLAELLQQEGYQTAAFVSAFPLKEEFGLSQGFDVYDDTLTRKRDDVPEMLQRPANVTTEAAIGWLEAHHEKPFFLFVHYFDPHAPYDPPEEFAKLFPRDSYAAEIAFADDQVGRLLSKLQELGLYDSATVIITSDHGEGLGEHGEETHSFFIYQTTAHVPLVFKPAHKGADDAGRGTRVKQPVSVVDIAPTFLDALGLAIPATMQGVSLLDYRHGKSPRAAGAGVYAESLVPTMFDCAPLRSLVADKWQYIWTVRPELYDLDEDPGQLDNVVGDYPEVADRLEAKLRAIIENPNATQPEASRLVLDDRARAKLQSLGYLGGTVQDHQDLDPSMRDPKDFMRAYQSIMQAEGMIASARFDEAARLCETLLRSEPDVFRAHQILAKVAQIQERESDAIAHYERAIDAAEKTLRRQHDEQRRAPLGVADARTTLGELLFRQGDIAEAREHFRAGMRDFPEYARVFYQYGGVLAELAAGNSDADEKAKLLAEARSVLEAAIEVKPESVEAHSNLGYVHLLGGDYEAARRHIQQAIALNPNHVPARNNLQRLRMLSDQ
ncbi:MAG: tetratricopeptide repeat protein [Planctomycetota bacterium]|nr:MAG: tetratricopeptide repeat protein [Planctomycetota bacterium]